MTAEAPAGTTPATGSFTTVYQVTGMSCGHCEGAVSGEISALADVVSVKAEAATGARHGRLDHGAGRGRRTGGGGRGGVRTGRAGLTNSLPRCRLHMGHKSFTKRPRSHRFMGNHSGTWRV